MNASAPATQPLKRAKKAYQNKMDELLNLRKEARINEAMATTKNVDAQSMEYGQQIKKLETATEGMGKIVTRIKESGSFPLEEIAFRPPHLPASHGASYYMPMSIIVGPV
ncbi:uncharacterized protein EHS24_004730 [Apiotrichum porosum]|uniref:Uncharacterized protein n=1 Tax=Apiotrichum porosum TaxID=105984 RepID=A0A427Y5Y8_9TREE|nr:uncharacterized protein EHS24_004730 [Apiotrichum porosum]RSH86474.1 hypothetical protein EHS24_004730 [Apiotrichum porosum]